MKLKRASTVFALTFALVVPQLARAEGDYKPGFIYTFAGNGAYGFSGDGGDALNAAFRYPSALAVAPDGDVYISDLVNHRIRRVYVDGKISTIAGTGVSGFFGDGGPATQAQLNFPLDVAVDAHANLYISDYGNYRIRKVSPEGIITTVAGNGVMSFSGDGGPATNASIKGAQGLTFDSAGNLHFADYRSGRVRKVDSVTGIITTVAGSGGSDFNDGGPATLTNMSPWDIAFDKDGNLYISDPDRYRIRRVDSNGIIETVVGNGQPYTSCTEPSLVPVPPYFIPRVCLPIATNGDGFTARSTSIHPAPIAFAPNGNLYIGTAGPWVRVWDRSTDRVFTIAGTGHEGYGGDGGPAKLASFTAMTSLAMLGEDLILADEGAGRIRIIHQPKPLGI